MPLSPTTKLLGAATAFTVLLTGGLIIRYAGTSGEPTLDASTPTPDTPAPTLDAPAPTVDTPAPTPDASAPTVDAPAPTLDTSAPTLTPGGVVPSRNKRQDPDVDRGTPIDYGVFVEIPLTWKRESLDSVVVTSLGRGAAAFYVSNHPVPSAGLLGPDVQGFADTAAIEAVEPGSVRKLPLPNRNIAEAAQLSFTGGYTDGDGVFQQLVRECTRFRGVATINDVSVSICYVSRSSPLDVVRADVAAMTASVARSI